MTNTFKATYAGGADGDIEAFGVIFEKGKAADVPDRYREKVGGNPFFKVGTAKAEPKSRDEKAASVAGLTK